MQVKAAVLPGVRQPFPVEQVELDPPRSGEVLVKLVATGVCHCDVHVYTQGQRAPTLPPHPRT